MRRRQFIAGLGGVVTWPLAARAQQAAMPVVGFVNGASGDASAANVTAFREGLGESGYVDGQNLIVEYHWLNGDYASLPALMGDLVRRRVAVIATPASTAPALAAKAATATIPIVFGVASDPVKLGLVASFPRPGGNATGIDILGSELSAKRLALLHDLVPKAVRIAVLINPANRANAEMTLRGVEEAAGGLGLQIRMFNATSGREIDAAFVTIEEERLDALFVGPDAFFAGRGVQLATLAARARVPSSCADREIVKAGGLMNYNIDLADSFRLVGAYAGRILKGAKPADLPVVLPTKFEFIINLQTARLLGIEVPPQLLALADEVIE
jgi:putative tryptophan/tyrosine transport system substrate-binding protein